MKNITQMVSGKMKIAGVLFVLATAFSSCLKDNNDDVVTQPSALISVVNASPDSQPLDFYLDQNRVNNSTGIVYGSGLDYRNAVTGKRTASFNISGTSNKIKSDTMTLVANRAYTLYLTNLVANPEYLLLKDTINRPTAGSALVRFVHVSANTPNVDLVTSTGTNIAVNKAYKTASGFTSINAGKYTMQVRQAGTATVLATITDKDLVAGAVYTIWLQGVNSATDDVKKLTAKTQVNAYFQ
ncbi:DUF4397 domain-containing protein [Mucilaginibacter aquatilis]|uniref:DUF4397 domain-containing protein n=1 Tax=Mucilaginibacter aquatilis TaxID=1517760 RepID=A0A6I4IPL4_9SPHI|nr:DUF4397 domain-containing protein [Mucilaginibacter aquatilis]MVN89534.1 DUF4397 domain-containing protein [Mucilaginibacter aquatilis]